MAGADAMKFAGWQRLNAEYAQQFGVEPPNGLPQKTGCGSPKLEDMNHETTLASSLDSHRI